MSGVKKISNDFYLLKDAKAAVTFTTNKTTDIVNPGSFQVSGAHRFVKWGADNLMPQKMLQLVSKNHIKPQLIGTSRDFLMGSRIGLFKRTIVEGKILVQPISNPEIEDWMEEVEANKYMRRSAYNLELSANKFTVFNLDAKRKVEEMRAFDFTDIRAEVLSASGRIENYFYHPDWARYNASEVQIIPAYKRRDPFRHAEFMYHGRDEMPGQTYYDWALWWGTEAWTEVSNLIPQFHKSGLTNGYNLKYHIKIPKDYFVQFGDLKAQLLAEDELLGKMNELLSGTKGVDKAFISKFATDQFGKQLPSWEIIPIENKMSDKAYSVVDTSSNVAHASGHAINPVLAGIDTGGKLGGSGSELRIAYQLHIALRTPNKRALLLEPFYIAKKLHGWDRDIIFGIEDIDLTTLDKNPTGTQATVNQSI